MELSEICGIFAMLDGARPRLLMALPAMLLQRPSNPVRVIKKLPNKRLALRLWNRVERLRGRAIAETVFGAKMRCDPRDIIQATVLHFGVWEPEITAVCRGIIQPGDIAIDVGANVGYYSLLFSKLGATTVAIEPHPALVHEIEENNRLNALNIRIKSAAATDRPGTVRLYEAPRTNTGMTTTEAGRFRTSIDVPGAPLLELLDDVQLKRISLIKIDIEGAEAPIMREILGNLERFGDRLAICVEVGSDWSDAFDGFLKRGFTAWRIQTNLQTLWTRLLNDETAAQPVKIKEFPSDQCDMLLMPAGSSLPA